jgi:GT2 family glycosyltransferase
VSHRFIESVFNVISDARYSIALAPQLSGPLIARARNLVVERFLSSDAEFLWFVDTDIVFDTRVPRDLIAQHRPIVSAHYLGQNIDGTTFNVASVIEDDELKRVEELEGLTKVEAVGMGCCMIRRQVLETLGTGDLWPFAELPGLGEDVTFCMRAKDKGFDSYVYAPCKVGHVKEHVI